MALGSGGRSQRGFTYLWVLMTVALLGISAALTGEVWQLQRQRAQEQQLLRVGHEFREAIRHYYEASPGGKSYPAVLEDLVKDPRFPGTKRYLRRVYKDPITGNAEWGVIRINGGIAGVHSLSEKSPIKVGGFLRDDAGFTHRENYSEWVFSYPTNLLVVKSE